MSGLLARARSRHRDGFGRMPTAPCDRQQKIALPPIAGCPGLRLDRIGPGFLLQAAFECGHQVHDRRSRRCRFRLYCPPFELGLDQLVERILVASRRLCCTRARVQQMELRADELLEIADDGRNDSMETE